MADPENRLEILPLLKATSRSFYLTVRILPGKIRPQIALAYLLARTIDTIADTEILPVDQRLAALSRLRERIEGKTSSPVTFENFAKNQGTDGERNLLRHCESLIGNVYAFSKSDQAHIRHVIKIITSGQELDLQRFSKAASSSIVALDSPEELDDYTWRVAGCVGEFWTHLCCEHLFRSTGPEKELLLAEGVRFGKGLQLVNILRDLPRDLQQGRCYLPNQELSKLGLSPEDLLHKENFSQLAPLYSSLLDQAEKHLTAGWNYTCNLPKNQFRLRLACAWPVLIGIKTVGLLRNSNPLDASQRVKVSRNEIYKMMLWSIFAVPFNSAFERLFDGYS